MNRALYGLQQRGIDSREIVRAAERLREAAAPADPDRLTDRLTALGMMMAPNRPHAEATVWLIEMKRLLSDLPEDILGEAIDGALLHCKFLPTVAEIRDRADPDMKRRRRALARLTALSDLAASGAVIRKIDPPPPEPRKPLTLTGPAPENRPRKPTRQDYIAMGVDPAILDQMKQDKAA